MQKDNSEILSQYIGDRVELDGSYGLSKTMDPNNKFIIALPLQ